MAIGTSQAFRTQNLRLLGNLFDKNNFIGRKGYYLNSTGDGVDWRADLNESSGIFYGGVISATIGGTTFNLSAGSGQVLTRALVNNEVVTTNKIVSWNAQNNITLTYRTTHQFSYIYIDENGTLQQQNSSFTDAEYQNKIVIGTICHINYSTINLVSNKQNIAYGDSHRIYEFANSFGPIKRSGLSIGAYSTNLRITRGAGSVFSIGCNYASDQFNADSPNISAANPALLCRVSQNGSGGFIFDTNSGSYYTDIDPNNYDNGSGTLQTVNNNQWTIQRLYFFPNNPNDVITYYGRAIYNSYTDAIAAISTESFSEATITLENAVFLGYLVLRGGATNLSSSSDGVFFQSGAFRNTGAITGGGGGGGGGATTLDDLTDVQLSSVLGGQFLTYDSTTSLWKNRSYILDANNNELIKFPSTVTGAVNELTISNAATTGSPSISATGDDTNIGLNLISKGTGLVQINGKAISLANSFTTSGNYPLAFTTTATTSLTLPTSGTLATTSQIPTVYDNTLTLAGSGGIGVGTSPTFTANSSTDKTITISIADGALTIAKLENIATSRILGRISAGTGAVELLDGSGVVSVIGTNAVTRTTNLAGGIAGQIPYQSGANTTSFSAAGTTNQVLLSGGSGAPTWANQSSLSVGSATTAGSLANALTIQSPLTGTSYNGSSAVTIGLQNATASLSGGVSTSAQTFGGDKTFANNVIISGDLTVNGTTVTVNTTTLAVKDKNIELGLVTTPSDVTADGGGITLKGTTDKTILWVDSTDAWTLSEHLNIASGKSYRINGNDVLSSTTLGSGVVNSSLTSVGTLTNLTVTNTITGSVSGSAGSLSGTYTFWGQNFNGTQNVSGNLTSVGNITGSSGITITAGGSNQNIVLTPSGTGYTLLNGSVGIGNSTPNNKLTIQAGDNKDSGPIINLGGNAINQFESGRIRFTEVVTGATPFYQGAYLHYDGSNNLFHIGVHDSADSLIASDTNVISIVRSSGIVGVGTTNPTAKLEVIHDATATSPTLYIKGGYAGNAIARFERIYGVTAGTTYVDINGSGGSAQLSIASANNTFALGVNNNTSAFEISDNSSIGTNTRLLIDSNGNVGIGTTAPAYKLDVNGITRFRDAVRFKNGVWNLTDDGQVRFYFDTSGRTYFGSGNGYEWRSVADAGLMALTNAGNLGVGTLSPLSRLDIRGSHSSGYGILNIISTDTAIISIDSTGSRDQGIRLKYNGADKWLIGLRDANDAFSISNASDTRLVSILQNGNVGIGATTPNNKLSISGSVNIGSNYNTAAPTNGLIVEGSVGIGTTSPGYLFTVNNASDVWHSQFGQVGGNQFRIGGNTTNGAVIGAYSDNSNNNPRQLLLNRDGGNVGIGVSNALNKLHVYSSVTGSGSERTTPVDVLTLESENTTAQEFTGFGQVIIFRGSTYNNNTQRTLGKIIHQINDDSVSTTRGTSLDFQLLTDATGSTLGSRMYIQHDGNVGISTATPSYKLDVNGNGRVGDAFYVTTATTADAKIEIGSGRSGNGNSYIDLVGDATYTDYGLRLIRSNGGANTTSAIAHRGTGTLYITAVEAASIALETSNTTRVTINSSGNVGIGNTSPSTLLQLRQTSATHQIFSINRANSATAALYIGNDSNDNALIASNNTNLRFGKDYLGTFSEYLRIDSSGNVGIGTSSPTNTIDVNGTARIRTISASGSAATIFLTTDANGVLISRTAAQVRSDIGAGTGNGTVTSVTGTAPIASSGGTTPAISLNDAGVTFAKIQNISSGTVIGRTAAGTGVTSEIDGAGIASIISTNAVTNSTNAANVTIATDDTTNSSYYLYFGANVSGNTPIKASTKIRYNPSSGAFSATTKSFRIPHPTKPQHDLVYGSLESPYHGIRLTGKGKTKGNRAEVILPDYVKVLIDENTINIQLTVIKCGKILYIDNINIDDNKFTVKYDKSWYEKSKDVEFYWDFTAERKDVPKLIVEEKL